MLNIEKNPYEEPVSKFYNELKETKWTFPYIPQAIHSIIIIFLIIILIFLYLTIGIVSQISSTFWNLIIQTGEKIDKNNPVQSSAYAIAIGVYFIFFLPFFFLQFPFWLIGWLISKIGFKAFIIAIILIIIIIYFFNDEIRNWLKIQ